MRCRARREAGRKFEKLYKRTCWLGPVLAGSFFYLLFLCFGKSVSTVFAAVFIFLSLCLAYNSVEMFIAAGILAAAVFVADRSLAGGPYSFLGASLVVFPGFCLYSYLFYLYDPEVKLIEKAGEAAEKEFKRDHPGAVFDFIQISEDDVEMVFHAKIGDEIRYYAVNPETLAVRLRDVPPEETAADD